VSQTVEKPATEPVAGVPGSSFAHQPLTRRLAGAGQQLGVLGALVVACLLFSILSPYFWTVDNGLNIGQAVSYTGIVAAITTMVLVAGGLDLSIGAVMALSSCLVADLLGSGMGLVPAVAIALAAGAGVGVVNGVLIARVGINAFVVTIGTQFIARGLAYLVTGGQAQSVTDQRIIDLGQGKIAGLPASLLLMLVAFALVGWMLARTQFGTHVYAIGGTPGGRMARLAGIKVERRLIQVYVLSATFAALAGIVVAGYTGTGDAAALLGVELTIIAAAILGGTSLLGGRGTVFGTLVGVLLLGVITNGIVLLDLGTSAQYLVQGAALLLAVVIDEVRTKRAAR